MSELRDVWITQFWNEECHGYIMNVSATPELAKHAQRMYNPEVGWEPYGQPYQRNFSKKATIQAQPYRIVDGTLTIEWRPLQSEFW